MSLYKFESSPTVEKNVFQLHITYRHRFKFPSNTLQKLNFHKFNTNIGFPFLITIWFISASISFTIFKIIFKFITNKCERKVILFIFVFDIKDLKNLIAQPLTTFH